MSLTAYRHLMVVDVLFLTLDFSNITCRNDFKVQQNLFETVPGVFPLERFQQGSFLLGLCHTKFEQTKYCQDLKFFGLSTALNQTVSVI